MKLEFLAEGSLDCPLIRLYEFDRSAVLQLRNLVSGLATGTAISAALDAQPWIERIGNCELEFRSGKRDHGIVQVGSSRFDCVLSCEGWLEIAFLLEPFCATEVPSGFQWLNETGEISLLISSSGTW